MVHSNQCQFRSSCVNPHVDGFRPCELVISYDRLSGVSGSCINVNAPNLLRLTPRPLFLMPVQDKAGSRASHLKVHESKWCLRGSHEEPALVEKDRSSLHLVFQSVEVIQ
jgi:hypothetical protein